MAARRFLLLAVAFLVGHPAFAQVTYDGCRDINGFAVASIRNDAIDDIAMATIYNGSPVIFYNVRVLAWTSPATRRFFYAHECAHHALGHTLGASYPTLREQQADCWAIQTLVAARQVSAADLQAIQFDISRLGRGDWSHLPGPQRAINLNSCLDQSRSQPPPSTPPQPLYCCNAYGYRVCQVGTSPPAQSGAACWCPGMPYGRTCR